MRRAVVASQIPRVRVVDEPRKGLVVARETGRRRASGDILIYLDADCRAPLTWVERIERRFDRDRALIAPVGPYRFYDWDWCGPRADSRLRLHGGARRRSCSSSTCCASAPSSTAATSPCAARRSSGSAASTRRSSFTAKTRTWAAACSPSGRSACSTTATCYTSARRYIAMGKGAVFRLYVRNFVSELLHHRPKDTIASGREDLMPGYEPFLLCDFHVHTQWSDGKLSRRAKSSTSTDRPASSTSSPSPITS